VISVACFGLYGAATSKWDMSVKVEESGAFEAFWDTLSFSVNGIVFFYSGAACINFFVRCVASHCNDPNPNPIPIHKRAAVLSARGARPGELWRTWWQPRHTLPGLAPLASLHRCWLCSLVFKRCVNGGHWRYRLAAQAAHGRESVRQMWRRMRAAPRRRCGSAEAAAAAGARARRSSQQLQAEGQLGLFLSTLWRFPLVYVFMFLIRFLLMAIFRPLFKITRQDLSFKEIAFACVAGLRGSVSLIMAQARARPARAAAGVAPCVVRLLEQPMEL